MDATLNGCLGTSSSVPLSAFHCFQNNVLRIALLIIIKVNIFHLKEELVYGHSGYGGQMAYADPVNNIGIAYLTNDLSVYGFGNDPKFKALEKELYSSLDRITKSDLSLNYETFSS